MAMAIAPDDSSDSLTDAELLDGTVLKDGFLRKLKTGRRKYFVLKSANLVGPAKLEYYDSYKRWSSRQRPKRIIFLEDAFKICRRIDVKNKLAIGLYMRDSTFSVICEDEESLQDWLGHMLSAKYYHDTEETDIDAIWDVNVKCKLKDEGPYRHYHLRGERTINGPYRLIMKSEEIVLCRMSKAKEQWDLTVPFIRGCASSQETFCVEMGRSFPLGPCELIFHTDHPSVAEGIHKRIANFMKEWRKDVDVRYNDSRSGPLIVKRRPSSVSTRSTAKASSSGIGSTKDPVRIRADTLPKTSTASTHMTTTQSFGGLNLATGRLSAPDNSTNLTSTLTAHGGGNGRRRHRSASQGYAKAWSSMSSRTSPARTGSPFSPSSGHCSDYASSVVSTEGDHDSSHRRMLNVSAPAIIFSGGTATMPTPSAMLTSTAGGGHCCHHILPHLLPNHPDGAVVSTQPPIMEENSENGSGEQCPDVKVVISNTHHGGDEYVPFDPDTELLRRLAQTTFSPSMPGDGLCSCGRGGMVAQLPQQPASTEEELLIWPSQRRSLSAMPATSSILASPAAVTVTTSGTEYLEMSPFPTGRGARARTLTASTTRSTTTASSGASSAGSAACIDNEYVPIDPQIERLPLNRRFSATAAEYGGTYVDLMTMSTVPRSRSTSAQRYGSSLTPGPPRRVASSVMRSRDPSR